MTTAERVDEAYERIAAVDRPEIWITLRDRDEVIAEARALDEGSALPLRGQVIAVKDNIDVGGIPTTAACPAYAYTPTRDAAVVAKLRAAGAIVLGKTNLDQFATGLVGTRSPYGAVRDARRPELVSGGSSSGSAVAVALGIADIALGTDTAGSGRVPAAFQGIVGAKPTRGLLSTDGVVPACRTLDCVSVFASDATSAERALWLMAGPSPESISGAAGLDRGWPGEAPLAAASSPRVGVPDTAALTGLSDASIAAFADAVGRFSALGAEIVPIDIEPLLEAGRLLYAGAFVAERAAAFGEFAASHPRAIDVSVLEIVSAAARLRAYELVSDGEQLARLRIAARATTAACDSILLPTVPRQPTIAEVQADPIGVNAELGRFTTFVNLIDMCAWTIPAGEADGRQFGVSLLAWAFGDRVLSDLAADFLKEPIRPPALGAPRGIELLVIGAHRRGEPLNHQLTNLGARFVGPATTATSYRMYSLATDPAKPGLVRVARGGCYIEGELWDVPTALLGTFLAGLPQPMTLGRVELSDQREVTGFLCEQIAVDGARDISEFGSWTRYPGRLEG